MVPKYMSLGVVAEYFDVTERTVRTWVNEEPGLSGAMIRRNGSPFIGSGAMGEFEDKYLFGDSLLDSIDDDEF
jgi:hypothetical protein